MANELQAKITADISDLEKKLGKAESLQESYAKSISKTQKDISENIAISRQYEKAIEQLNKELADGTISQKDYSKQLQRIKRDEKETQIETSNLRKELTRLKRDQKDLSTSTQQVSKGMGQVGKSTANATPTVIEFSRVIQDAPYGIQGVANNIQQLTTNFGYLQKQAGGTIPALKAFAGSFLGPAGIVFAVSAVTSLLVSYGDELFKSVSGTRELSKASAEYVGQAKSEIVTLQSLVRIASNEALSKEIRQKAIDDINKNYSEYLGNLDLETVKTDAVRSSIDKLIDSLVTRAKIEGLQSLITEKAKDSAEDIVDAELQKTDAYKRVNSEINKLAKNNAFIGQQLANVKGERERINTLLELARKYEDVRRVSSGAISAIAEFRGSANDVNELNKELDDSIKNLVTLQEGYRVKLYAEEIEIGNVDDGAVVIEAKKGQAKEQARNILEPLQSELNSQGIVLPEFKMPTGISGGLDLVTEKQKEDLINRLAAMQKETQVFANVASAALGGFSTKLADVFKTGNDILDASVAAIIKSGEQLLQELIKQSIQASTIKKATAVTDIATNQAVATSGAIAAGSQTAAASGPAAAFLLPALIGAAIGFIAASFAGIKFAHGGIVPGGSYTGDKVPAFLNSGEVVMNGRQQANTLMAIAEGNANYGRNTTKDSDITLNAVLRGQNQIVQFNRASKFNKRFNG